MLDSIRQALDFGDVPTWLATVGAFIAAYFALRAFQAEQDRDERQEQADNRAQAEKVAAWVATVDDTRHPGIPGWTAGFVIRNASELPVYDVDVTLFAGGDSWAVSIIRVLPPGTEEYPVPAPMIANLTETVDEDLQSSDIVEMTSVILRFRDASGRLWSRDTSGVLAPSQPAVPF